MLGAPILERCFRQAPAEAVEWSGLEVKKDDCCGGWLGTRKHGLEAGMGGDISIFSQKTHLSMNFWGS